jgi:hypothetical protein
MMVRAEWDMHGQGVAELRHFMQVVCSSVVL